MSLNNTLLSRIQKLMALAEHNGNAHEAASALRHAQRLMKKYGIDRDTLMLSAVSEATCERLPTDAASIPGWLNALVSVVCMTAGCRSYFGWSQETQKRRRCVSFYGFGERPVVACYLFSVVSRQLKADAQAYLHAFCAHPLLKLSTVRKRMAEYRLYWVAGVWSVLEAFEPTEQEKQVLNRWLLQHHQRLQPATLQKKKRCGQPQHLRRIAYQAGSQAQIYPAMSASEHDEHPDNLLEVSHG